MGVKALRDALTEGAALPRCQTLLTVRARPGRRHVELQLPAIRAGYHCRSGLKAPGGKLLRQVGRQCCNEGKLLRGQTQKALRFADPQNGFLTTKKQ